MRETFRSERHHALDSNYPSCSGGNCAQGRGCGTRQACEATDSPLTWGGVLMAVAIVAACAGFVLMGPLAQGFIKGLM